MSDAEQAPLTMPGTNHISITTKTQVDTAVGIVAIGRNEGTRFTRCLTAMSSANAVAYVDSGSTDGSPQWARMRGADVVDLDMTLPFTAARGRNAGCRRLQELAPDC